MSGGEHGWFFHSVHTVQWMIHSLYIYSFCPVRRKEKAAFGIMGETRPDGFQRERMDYNLIRTSSSSLVDGC